MQTMNLDRLLGLIHRKASLAVVGVVLVQVIMGGIQYLLESPIDLILGTQMQIMPVYAGLAAMWFVISVTVKRYMAGTET